MGLVGRCIVSRFLDGPSQVKMTITFFEMRLDMLVGVGFLQIIWVQSTERVDQCYFIIAVPLYEY